MQIVECLSNYEKSVKATSSAGNYEFVNHNISMVQKFFDQKLYQTTEQITVNTMYELVEYFKSRNNVSNSINKKIGCLKRALKHNAILIPGVNVFPKISFKRVSFNILCESELQKCITHFVWLDKTPVNLTKSLLFWVFLYSGARLSEVLNIRVCDINFDDHTIYLFHTKNNEPRTVFFNGIIDNDLKAYIELKKRNLLFWNFKPYKDCPLNKDNVEAIFCHVKDTLKLPKFSPHMLRHTMATLLLENDAPLNSIKELLGHKSLTTTQIYLHASTKKLRQDYDKYFPLL